MRPIPRVRAPRLLRRLPRRQQEVLEAAAVLGERRGVSVYLVGGPVRDLILGSPGTDLDITVAGNAVPYAEALAASLGARGTIHPRFGTAIRPLFLRCFQQRLTRISSAGTSPSMRWRSGSPRGAGNCSIPSADSRTSGEGA